MPDDGWTVGTLRAHLQQQHEDLKESIREWNRLADEAAVRLRADYDERFRSVNEFRNQLADQAARFVTRDEAGTAHRAIQEQLQAATNRNSERISELLSRLDRMQGQDSGSAAEEANRRARLNQAIAVAAVLVTLAALIFAAIKR